MPYVTQFLGGSKHYEKFKIQKVFEEVFVSYREGFLSQ